MRILYDCFSCSPYYGSDEGLGWMWPYKMSKYHEVWVLIRKDRKEGIDRYCKENNIRGIHFVYCDLPDSPSSVDVLGKFRSFDRPEFQTSWHRLSDRPLAT